MNPQTISAANNVAQNQVFFVVNLDSTVARLNERIIVGADVNYLFVRQVPLAGSLNLTLQANGFDPPLPLLPGDKIVIRNRQLCVSNNALGAGAAPIILVFSNDPNIFSIV